MVGVEILGHAVVVRLEGRLDATAVPVLRARLASVEIRRRQRVVFDLRGVDVMDSTGLGLIVATLRRVRDAQADMAVFGLSKQVRSLFVLTRMERLFGIYDDEAAALDGA